MRENSRVLARFLLGPAGSGKTHRCLSEIRDALATSPAGPPLILLAPKQATFQLERQLLAGPGLAGFTRLNIFSFERLARFILEQLNLPPPRLLSEEGRVMVLRALLRRHEPDLKLFRGSARHAGFARELATLLAELQQHQMPPARLRTLAANPALHRDLRDKLHDLALLLEKYLDWLREHDLQDAGCFLDFATAALRDAAKIKAAGLAVESLWLDGFAEMTPQELALLTAFIPLCERATLAFCLETEPVSETSWLSIWSAIGRTFQECRARIASQPGCEVTVQTLKREPGRNRFLEHSMLARLEKNWAQPPGDDPGPVATGGSQLKIVACANPEAEAAFAAREVLKFIRAGNRLRDCAVLVRQLAGYHQPLARAFRRYGIPFFLDRRENVAHHPLAELTRNALRTVAFDWQNDDWFAALKAGFSPVAEDKIDRLENAALEHGWRGRKWREPLPNEAFERLRIVLYPPFETFFAALARANSQPDGSQLAAALRGLWKDLKVEARLQTWSDEQAADANPAIHRTVWDQMNSWLDNLVLAFPHESLPLRDWLPILDAGLANLTVGVIPPVLDEVLIGAIDRARNPDLKFALILGVNDSVFPAAPEAPAILTNADREELEKQNSGFGLDLFHRISRERYLGYIACTRANAQLTLSFSRQSAAGATLNPSPFVAHLQRLFPGLEVEEVAAAQDWRAAEHAGELIAPLVELGTAAPGHWPALLELPVVKSLSKRLSALREPAEDENLSPALTEALYGSTLKSSVSRLEEFAQCPFRFFVRSGLHAGERKIFELDVRERGNFQHDVLNLFHLELQAEGKLWRDLTPPEARARIACIAAAQMEHFRDGLMQDSAETRITAHSLAGALQDFVEVVITWMRGQYDFDPAAAELGFGGREDATGPWEIGLGTGRRLALQGRIDRVDLFRDAVNATTLAVVMDYKSGSRRLDPLLVANGVQLQLLAYLGALRQWKNPRAIFDAEKITPVGAFYVNLRGEFKGGSSRTEVLADVEAKKQAYRHSGRFDFDVLRRFDHRPEVKKGDQFNFRLNKDGKLPSNSAEALQHSEFMHLMDQVEAQLRALGERIFSGSAAVDPYRKGQQKACDYCDYRAACRIDEWTHEWRVLRATEVSEAT